MKLSTPVVTDSTKTRLRDALAGCTGGTQEGDLLCRFKCRDGPQIVIVRSRARRRPGSPGRRGFCPPFNLERVLTYITPPVLSCLMVPMNAYVMGRAK